MSPAGAAPANAQPTGPGASPPAPAAGAGTAPGLLQPLPGVGNGRRLPFTLDGQPLSGRDGESVLAALLAHGALLRRHEVDGSPRAGFCAIGACQDCWIGTAQGQRLRACTTPLRAGLALRSGTGPIGMPPGEPGPADATGPSTSPR